MCPEMSAPPRSEFPAPVSPLLRSGGGGGGGGTLVETEVFSCHGSFNSQGSGGFLLASPGLLGAWGPVAETLDDELDGICLAAPMELFIWATSEVSWLIC